MTVGWLAAGGPEARPTFVAPARALGAPAGADDRLGAGLSMGMSDDYEVAIEEGSTLVRVGRALFGERPVAAVRGAGARPPRSSGSLSMAFIVLVLQALVVAAWLVMLGRVLMSWVDPRFERPVSRLVYRLTEPVLAPVRRVLPQTGIVATSRRSSCCSAWAS